MLEETNGKLKNKRSKLEKTKSNIENRIQGILSKKHMDEIFNIEMEGIRKIKGISYKIDETRKEYIINKYFGKKLIITNRDDWSAEEIIKTYHNQDCIEKIFRDSKNSEHFSIRPQYHYTDPKIRVRIFCCLLGLVLATIFIITLFVNYKHSLKAPIFHIFIYKNRQLSTVSFTIIKLAQEVVSVILVNVACLLSVRLSKRIHMRLSMPNI